MAGGEYETILYAPTGRVATITLNRPERLNTIVPPMPDEVEAAVGARDARRRGQGDRPPRRRPRRSAPATTSAAAFTTGTRRSTTDGRWDPGKDFAFATAPEIAPTQKFMSVWRSPKPVIAQVHGWCVGGGSDFALCADLVIASEDAGSAPPTARMWGAYLSGMWIYRLGLAKAKEHALTGRPLSGREAAEIELINEAVPFAELEDTVAELAAELAPDPVLAARGDEAGRQPGLREHGPGARPRRSARSSTG